MSFDHTHVVVRGLPSTFASDALTMQPPEHPIDLQLATQQLRGYIDVVKGIVGEANVTELTADDATPDCCFVEDTAVIIGTAPFKRTSAIAILSHPGAESRRAEVEPIRAALQRLGFSEQPDEQSPHKLYQLTAPATLDGGDVLFTGSSLWVGLSTRTNRAAVDQMARMLEGVCPVYGMVLPGGGGLHLKSLMTSLSSSVILVADIPQGRQLAALAEATPGAMQGHTFVYLPDMICANVVRIGQHVVFQAGHPASEAIVRPACEGLGLTLHCVPFGEFAKADGALTCCSLLFSLP